MAWVEFHASRIKKLLKFRDFRKALNWSANEALGFLGSFWGEIIELREDGDITGWNPEYLADLTDAKVDPERLWKALENGWIDKGLNGKVLVHDWLDAAGLFLMRKYSTNNKEELARIWALYGRVYGTSERIANEKRTNSEPTKPNLTKPTKPKPQAYGVLKSSRTVVAVDVGGVQGGKVKGNEISSVEEQTISRAVEFSGDVGSRAFFQKAVKVLGPGLVDEAIGEVRMREDSGSVSSRKKYLTALLDDWMKLRVR